MAARSQTQGLAVYNGFEQWQLDALAEATCDGVEAFIEQLEDWLESGEITRAEAEMAINDFWRCK